MRRRQRAEHAMSAVLRLSRYRALIQLSDDFSQSARLSEGGLQGQDWALRVTLGFRREKHDWRLVHRHADPLVEGISLAQAVALARPRSPAPAESRAEGR